MAQPKLSKLSLWGDANAWKEGRAYRHPVTREQFPSVTTVLKLVDKSALAQWAADNAILWAIENGDMLNSRSPEAAFTAGRFAWNRVRDERAEVGTGVHETVEALHTQSWAFPVLDEEQQLIMKQWELLNEDHLIVPLLSEFTVFNKTAGVMGTADGYWEVTCLHDGPTCLGQGAGEMVLALIDLKTSKNHWPEHDYQLAALWGAGEWLIETSDMVWTPEPARHVDKVAIVHLRADKRKFILVDSLVQNLDIFDAYAGVWYALEAKKAKLKDDKTEVLASGFTG